MFQWILLTQFIPAVTIVLPFYVMFRQLGLLDTYTALIIVDLAIVLPYAIWTIKGFIDAIPIETEEAAIVDGASRARVIWDIVVPMARPGILTAAIFCFIITWNEFLFGYLLSRQRVVPLPVGIISLRARARAGLGADRGHWNHHHDSDVLLRADHSAAFHQGHEPRRRALSAGGAPMAGVSSSRRQQALGRLRRRRATSTSTVVDQEFLVLLGPSGCGKTTTMRMVAGLEEPTEGEIWIGDELVNDMAPRERDVAMVFQNYGLYPHMTVRDNIGYPLKVRGIAEGRSAEDGRRPPPRRSSSGPSSTASPVSSREGSASAWPSPARSCARRACSSWTSRSRTSTRSCASRCAPSSSTYTTSCESPRSTSRTTRWRR